MESKKINQLATELSPVLSDLTIIGDPSTGISKKITLSQMASLFTGTVEEYPNLASFPLVGTADTIYIALDTNVLYRWDTGLTSYVELSPNIINSLVFSDANGFDGNISLVGSTATLTITTALTQGSIPFIGTSGALTQDNANLFFDDTNNRLGINTNAPTTALDVFGSGIIGRINGTSTNNAFLGFASAGSNKWSIGNVQSDHRFRIYNEATTSELVSVLQTGEFGIGIANPTTKLHIDGGASALIANLDANVSVAKSISFRSDNSARINLEVSGTESGSNAGGNFFIRRYSDAGSLIDTPFTITRSTGNILLASSSAITFNINSLKWAELDSSGLTLYNSGGTNTARISGNGVSYINGGNFGVGDTPLTLVHFSGSAPTLTLTDSAATGNNGNFYINVNKIGIGYNNLTTTALTHTFKGGGSATEFLKIDSDGSIITPAVNTNTTVILGVANASGNSFVSAKRGSIQLQASSAVSGANSMGGGDVTIKAGNSYSSGGGISGDINLVAGYNLLGTSDSAINMYTKNTLAVKINSSGVVKRVLQPYAAGGFNSDLTVSANTFTKLIYQTNVGYHQYNINSCWDNTNYRFTAPETCQVVLSASVFQSSAVIGQIAIYINGARRQALPFSGSGTSQGCMIVPLNAGDYLEFFGYGNGGTIASNPFHTFFHIYML
jgi:hypothetical protein